MIQHVLDPTRCPTGNYGHAVTSLSNPIAAAETLVLDTPLDALSSGDVDELTDRVRRGARLFVVLHPGDQAASLLAGAEVVDTEPVTEWFVTLADRPEAARLDREVPVRSGLRHLRTTSDDVQVAATTSVRFEHRTVLTVRPLGQGIVVGSGLDAEAARNHRVIGHFIDRLLAGANEPVITTMGVAVVGYGPFGGMGYTHGLACTETDGLELVAAVDTSPDRLEAARADFPELRVYADATAMAADDGVDVAIIATPPVFHAPLALELLRAGKHVVLEKPMCLTLEQADELLAAAQASGTTLTVHQSRRWDRDYLALERAIEQGRIGEVFNIETFVGGFEHPCRAWHSEDTVSGGAVYDWGSHHIDWIVQLYGSAPRRVMCNSHTRVWHDTSNVDQLSVWMQWDDGREATFRQSDVAAIRRPKFYVQGTEGTIEGRYRSLRNERLEAGRGHLDGWHHHAEAPVDLQLARYESDYGITETLLPPVPHPGWGFHRNLADHLLAGEPLAVDPKQSRAVVAVLEAAHESGASGGVVIELPDLVIS